MKFFGSLLLSIFIRVGLFISFCVGCFALYTYMTDPLTTLSCQRSPNGKLVAENILDTTDGPGGGEEVIVIEFNPRTPGSPLPETRFTIMEAYFRKDIVFNWTDDGHLMLLTEAGSRPLVGPTELNGVQLEYETYPRKGQ